MNISKELIEVYNIALQTFADEAKEVILNTECPLDILDIDLILERLEVNTNGSKED